MSDSSINVPDGYEVHETIEASASIGQYIARHKADDALVRLEMFDFSQTASATTRRHLREYLRTNITFMEELELAGVLRVFDYSDTKTLFWVATQPAEVYKLSKRFDLLASQPLQRRQGLVRQFLATVQAIHGLNVAHRSLSSDAVFLSSDLEVFIGEFGFACYFTDHSATSTDTTSVTAACYQPPEVRDAKTLACDVRCDVFSCGLLAFEILSATMLPKDEPAGICEVVRARLNEPAVRAIIGVDAAEVILKAVTPLPEERWLNVSDFADALQRSLQDGPAERPAPVDPTATVGITKPVESSATVAIQADAETMRAPSGPAVRPVDAADGVTPLDPKHEIWNNRYEILDKIGEGGQAIVYKAYDHLTNEEIAIKTIWSRHRDDRSAINRLKQGAMVARSLTHRHIIKTYSVEQRMDTEGLGKHVFICMELIRSQMELRDVIEARQAADQKIRVDEALHIIRQLLDALAYAHEHTIHRDIKPGNIMLVPRGDQTEIDSSDLTKFDIRLIDFGIAKVLSQKHIDVTGKGFRSAHYGAPELADAKTGVDARADIFSVGVILYQMLTKALPHKGSPPANKANKDVPAALAKVIDRAVNADRAKRFKTASEILTEIDKAVSKFNWVRKAARVAAILLVAAGAAGAVKYFLPEPDYGYVQPTIETLEARAPDKEIAALDESSIVKLSDVEDYGSYDELRKKAIENLRIVEMAGNDRFNKRSFAPWSDQEQVWMQIEPAVSKIESIATDRKEYVARKDMPVVTALVGLSPSAERLEEVRNKTSRAETLLKTRSFSHDDLELCADAYDLGAKVYQNIEVLAGGSDRAETAVQINNELKNVEELRSSFLQTHASLDVERLGDSGFDDLRERCLQKANRYCQSFELGGATKYFSLLTQICGTMAAVQDQIDFKRSDMALVSTRLMDLCYEDIEAFENYPAWQQRLQQVHRTKDFLAKYRVFQALVSSISENAPAEVYDHAGEARRLCEQGELDEAAAELAAAAQQHKDFIRQRLEQMNRDCDFLSTCKGVNTDSIADPQRSLSALSDLIDRPDWPQGNFADQYNRCLEAITSTKGTVRQALIGQARQLKQEITQAGRTAQQQDFFWKSERIGKYVAVAAKYRADEVEDSIAMWKHVEDLRRISRIVEQMRSFDSYLAKMLARKLELDGLAEKIDKDIRFCTQFKGISQQEKDQYRSWQSELEQLRSRLTARQAGTYLIDHEDQAYRAEYDDVSSTAAEIHDKLPYHRNRVIQLMDRTQILQKTAEQVLALRQLWAGVLERLRQSRLKQDFAQARAYLESVTEQVNEWNAERFSRQMRPKCKVLADGLNEQSRAVATLISAILDEKSRLVNAMASLEEAVAETLNDPDVRKLDGLAAADRSPALAAFRQLPTQLP
ncbi:MAG: protein kinase domain-containing protein, partial [Planctomycetota bacterium]